MSIHFEAVLWISSLGHIIASFFILTSILTYSYFKDTKQWLLLGLSFISLLFAMFFHEFAVIGPLLILSLDLITDHKNLRKHLKSKIWYVAFLSLIPLYYLLRSNAKSLWFAGDYRYSLVDLPLNFVGNAVSYPVLIIAGPNALYPLQQVRLFATQNFLLTIVLLIVLFGIGLLVFLHMKKRLSHSTYTLKLICKALFIVPLLPFLGLGNISPRYTYLASFGVMLFAVYLIKKFYDGAERKNKKIIAIIFSVFILLFSYYQISSLVSVNKHWQKAGEIVNNTLVNITYSINQENQPPLVNPEFYFINLPIRYGSAWIFPVGLQDALWFSYRDTDLKITVTKDEQSAQNHANQNRNVKVFKYLEDGSLVEYTPPITPTPSLSL